MLKRVKIDDNNIYGVYFELFELLHVLGQIAASQKPRVHRRVQRFHSSVEALGKTRYVADSYVLHARVRKRFRRAACGNDFVAERAKLAGKFHHSRLVAYAD